MSVGRPRWTWRSTCSIACRNWDARSTSASPDPGRGWGQCGPTPDPCTTLPGVGAKRAGVAEPAHEGLVDQHGRGLHADAAHTSEPLDHLLRLPRCLPLDRLVALRFQVGHLLANQVEAIEQPLNLRPSVRG